MNKNEILNKLQEFNIDEAARFKRNLGITADMLTENVVIAPFYKAETFADVCGAKVELLFEKYYKTYRVSKNGKEFIFVNSNMGSGNIAEIMCTLAGTNCKNVYFIGSAGSIDLNLKIGDIVLPEKSVIGDGTCRYFAETKDVFGNETEPNAELLNSLKQTLSKMNIGFKTTKNFSVDTLSGQFLIMDHIFKTGANTLEMETSALFFISKLLDLKAVAIHNISDNSIINKSLFSGRNESEREAKRFTQRVTIPKILAEILL